MTFFLSKKIKKLYFVCNVRRQGAEFSLKKKKQKSKEANKKLWGHRRDKVFSLCVPWVTGEGVAAAPTAAEEI